MANGLFEDLLTGVGLGFLFSHVLGASVEKDRARMAANDRVFADALGITVDELHRREEEAEREKQIAKQQKREEMHARCSKLWTNPRKLR